MDYKRYFVTLRCDGKGYEYKNRRPLGQCVIERRGTVNKISIMVQDLKPETVYSPYIIFCREGRNIGVPVGKLAVNERGKGELKWELEESAEKKLPSLDGFCAIVVLVHKKEEFVSPLVGFKEEDVLWKNNLQLLDGISELESAPKRTEKAKRVEEYKEKPAVEGPVKEADVDAEASEEIATVSIEGATLAVEKTVAESTAVVTEKPVEVAAIEEMEKPVDESAATAVLMHQSVNDGAASPERSAEAITDTGMLSDETDVMKANKPIVTSAWVAESERIEAAEASENHQPTEGTSANEGEIRSESIKAAAMNPLKEAAAVLNQTPEEEIAATIATEKNIEVAAMPDNNPAKEAEKQPGNRHNNPDNEFFEKINKETAVLHDNFKSMAMKFRKEMEELENIQFYPDGETEEERATGPQSDVNTSELHAPEKKSEAKDELDYIFQHNISLTPFKRQNRAVKWVRISLKEPVSLPINYQLLMKSPFVILAFKKYHHLIMGVTTEAANRQYILGIPGEYEPENRGAAIRLGFTQFKCCDDIKPSHGEYGYWLMFIDA